MADIDMIPRSYRDTVRARRLLAGYGTALVLLLVAGGGACALLRWRLAVETPRLEQARAGAGQSQAAAARLAEAQQRRDLLASDAGALAMLRGAGDVAVLARAFEQALDEKVWFTQVRFSRTREVLPALPSPPAPGTLVARGTAQGPEQAWRIGSHVEIAGAALDQQSMAVFLTRISADPALDNVRFLNSSTEAAAAVPPADATDAELSFSAAASLRNNRKHAHE